LGVVEVAKELKITRMWVTDEVDNLVWAIDAADGLGPRESANLLFASACTFHYLQAAAPSWNRPQFYLHMETDEGNNISVEEMIEMVSLQDSLGRLLNRHPLVDDDDDPR
jgi:hypothetical protein